MNKGVLVLGLASVMSVFPVLADESSGSSHGDINILLGQKFLDEDDWEPLDEQAVFGVQANFGMAGWPLDMVIGLIASSDDDELSADGALFGFDDVDVEGSTTELRFGLQKNFEVASDFRLYINGGIAYITAEIEAEALGFTVKDDDSDLGNWFGAGALWTLNDSFNLGLDIAVSGADVELFGVNGEAGGSFVALALGYHWE